MCQALGDTCGPKVVREGGEAELLVRELQVEVSTPVERKIRQHDSEGLEAQSGLVTRKTSLGGGGGGTLELTFKCQEVTSTVDI